MKTSCPLNELDNEVGCNAKSSFENNINYRWRRGQGGVALLRNKSKISVQKIYTNSVAWLRVKTCTQKQY